MHLPCRVYDAHLSFLVKQPLWDYYYYIAALCAPDDFVHQQKIEITRVCLSSVWKNIRGKKKKATCWQGCYQAYLHTIVIHHFIIVKGHPLNIRRIHIQ